MIYLYVHRTFDFHIMDITRYITFLSYIAYIGCIYIYISTVILYIQVYIRNPFGSSI